METDFVAARRARRVSLTLAAIAAIAVAWWGGQEAAPHLLTLAEDARATGPAAPVLFILIYAFAVVALIPASLLTLAGGAVFGFVRGVLYALVGATVGSTVAFLLGRYVARGLVARWLTRKPRFASIERAVSADGRRIVFLLRLSPVAPFNVLNYALGVTTITLTDFVVASIGMVPGTIGYAYVGKVTGEALVFAGKAQVPHNASYYAVLLLGLVATVTVTAVVTRTARRALRDV